MIRAAPPLALTLALALAACHQDSSGGCPGSPVVTVRFGGERVTQGTLGAGLDPSPAVTDCPVPPEGTVDPFGFPTTLAFSGTVAASPGSSSAALCPRSGTPLTGTRAGDRWTVGAESSGAVLGGCGASCSATSRVTVIGDVTPSAAAPTGFAGALVEVIFDAGDCGSCATRPLPCAGRFTLAGPKEGP